jgi:hypothetical protein
MTLAAEEPAEILSHIGIKYLTHNKPTNAAGRWLSLRYAKLAQSVVG